MVTRRFRRLTCGLLAVTALGLVAAVPTEATAATPYLTVSTTPALYPAFTTTITNYVIRCVPPQPVQVQVTAQPGNQVSVDGQAGKTGTFSATVNKLSPGQEFLITNYGGGGRSTKYHVRCLPSDFPQWTSARSAPTQAAFYIVTPSLSFGGSGAAPYVAVFDNNGVPRWWMASGATAHGPLDAKALANGDLVWNQFNVPTGSPTEYTLNGTLVRNYPGDAGLGGGVDFHELQVLPNGNYLLANVTHTVQADLSQCGAPAGTTGPVTDPQIEELSPTGTLIWSWDAYMHIPLSEVSPAWYSACRTGDAYHFNAIEYGAATPSTPENVLVSFRHLDAIYDIDTKTSNINWKLGGTSRTESLTVLNDPAYTSGGGFGGQHDVRLFHNGTINVTLHDNGTDRSRAPRAVRYRIDPAAKTATLVEQVTDSSVASSPCCGSARKLEGGDWVISWGGTSGASPVGHIEEMSANGASTLFQLTLLSNVFSYRVAPVTTSGRYAESATWGSALTTGMNTQHPRKPGG